jgi:hypothetical protein
MNADEFVAVVKMQASDSAVEGTIKTLKQPAGRKPAEKLVQLSEWYNQLAPRDQAMLGEALREAAEAAIFGFFCILDGVRPAEDDANKGVLELHFLKSGERTRLNEPDQEELHNIFNGLCLAGS